MPLSKSGVKPNLRLDFARDAGMCFDLRELEHRLGVVGHRAVAVDGDGHRAHAQEAEGHEAEGEDAPDRP